MAGEWRWEGRGREGVVTSSIVLAPAMKDHKICFICQDFLLYTHTTRQTHTAFTAGKIAAFTIIYSIHVCSTMQGAARKLGKII